MRCSPGCAHKANQRICGEQSDPTSERKRVKWGWAGLDYHPKGLEPKGLDPKGLEPKGSRVTNMGFVSGSPETGLQPRWSTFLVCTSFLSPKGAGLWTVDWQFQKEGFPAVHPHRKHAYVCNHAACSCSAHQVLDSFVLRSVLSRLQLQFSEEGPPWLPSHALPSLWIPRTWPCCCGRRIGWNSWACRRPD